jgi:hypothetical protein
LCHGESFFYPSAEQAYAMDHQQIVNGKTIDRKKFQNGVMLCATRQTAAVVSNRNSLRQEPGAADGPYSVVLKTICEGHA